MTLRDQSDTGEPMRVFPKRELLEHGIANALIHADDETDPALAAAYSLQAIAGALTLMIVEQRG